MTDEKQANDVQDPAEPYEADSTVEVTPQNDPDGVTTHAEDDNPESRTGGFVDQSGLDEN